MLFVGLLEPKRQLCPLSKQLRGSIYKTTSSKTKEERVTVEYDYQSSNVRQDGTTQFLQLLEIVYKLPMLFELFHEFRDAIEQFRVPSGSSSPPKLDIHHPIRQPNYKNLFPISEQTLTVPKCRSFQRCRHRNRVSFQPTIGLHIFVHC